MGPRPALKTSQGAPEPLPICVACGSPRLRRSHPQNWTKLLPGPVCRVEVWGEGCMAAEDDFSGRGGVTLPNKCFVVLLPCGHGDAEVRYL